MGHNYMGHNYKGHTYVGHNYMGHNYGVAIARASGPATHSTFFFVFP